MRVLLVSPWFPSPAFGGSLIRVFETLRHLSQRHDVTLLAPVGERPTPRHLKAITDLGAEVVTIPVSETRAAVAGRLGRGLLRRQPFIQGLHYDVSLARELRRLTSTHAYDVIQVEQSFMAPYVNWVSPDNPARMVLSMHNIESLRFRRELGVARWGLRRLALAGDHVLFGSWEPRALRQFDGVTAVSPLEADWVRRHAPAAEVTVVPNGVSLQHFRPLDRIGASRTIVFSGLMNYPPNADAAVWLCDAILPGIARRFPDVKVVIVGDKPLKTVRALARRAVVEVTGRVPDVRPYLAGADAVVVPLRSGAGTRLKILEAMAMERPVVATSQGAEGLNVTSGMNILIGDTAASFADHVCTLLADPRSGDCLGREGRRLVEDVYDWSLCFRNLDVLYERLTNMSVTRAADREAVAR